MKKVHLFKLTAILLGMFLAITALKLAVRLSRPKKQPTTVPAAMKHP